jgi:hypothetical protein
VARVPSLTVAVALAVLIAASSSVAIGHAALDTAIANYPDQRFTPRNGIQVIRHHKPGLLPSK